MNKTQIKDIINKSNPIIFEIGCADGLDTIEFLEIFGDDLTIYCFEPDIRNIETFLNGGHRPFALNVTQGIKNKNVFLENKAIGSIDGIVDFYQSNTTYSSSIKKYTKNCMDNFGNIKLYDNITGLTFDNIIKVNCVTLDAYVSDKNIDIIDFVWADVQCAEDLMIIGGKNTFENKVRYLYTEYAKTKNYEYYENSPNLEKILELLGNNWILLQDFETEILLKNTNFK